MTGDVGYFNNVACKQPNSCVFTGDVWSWWLHEALRSLFFALSLSRITPAAVTDPHLPPHTGGPWKGLSHIATHNDLLARAHHWPGDYPSKCAECSKDNEACEPHATH